MKKTILTHFMIGSLLSVLPTAGVLASAQPFHSSANVIAWILKDEAVWKTLGQEHPITSIVGKPGITQDDRDETFEITAGNCSVMVVIKKQKSDFPVMPGYDPRKSITVSEKVCH